MPKSFTTKAVIDNTIFAGVMRLYCPDVDMHRVFLRNYPEHFEIDQQSLADFLTAVVVYDVVVLESSSGWNERQLLQAYRKDSWVGALLKYLPQEIVASISETHVPDITEEDCCRKAYDVMCSPLKDKIALRPGEKLPNVYSSSDYLYRPIFEQLNQQNDHRLDDNELAQAMFLHRGLFLQGLAHRSESVYLPYHYRGRMLAQLPPLIWVKEPDDGLIRARLPLAKGNRPTEDDYARKLNDYYYSLLETVSWKTYARDIPFIGAAVLAKAEGNPRNAFDIALELRSKGELKRTFARLHDAARHYDRPRFERIIEDYQSQLQSAARHLGVRIENPMLNRFYKLVTAFLPKSIQAAVDAAVGLLPRAMRDWGKTTASTLITKNSLQLLFVDHVRSIQHG